MSILSHNVSKIIASEPIKTIPYLENEAVKFIDYTYLIYLIPLFAWYSKIDLKYATA